jgi:hypothetical protein
VAVRVRKATPRLATSVNVRTFAAVRPRTNCWASDSENASGSVAVRVRRIACRVAVSL